MKILEEERTMNKSMDKRKIFYMSVFLFFFVILCLSPISGDDWGNYEVGKLGLYHSIGNAVGMYFDWEGRFISRILINVLTYHKYLWNLVNSILITLTVYFSVQMIRPKKKKFIYVLSFLSLLLMNIYTFSQTITWIAGNITYFFVIPVLLGYFYLLLYDKRESKIKKAFFILVNLFAPMFVEHMALILVAGNIILLFFYYYKEKKWKKELLLYICLSMISTLSMFLSPGSRKRSLVENVEFNQLNIFEKVFYNLPNFVYYTFITNPFMLVLSIMSQYLLVKKYINNKIGKIALFLFLFPMAIVTIILYPITCFYPNKLSFLINQNHIWILLYWLCYLIITFGLFVIDGIKNKNGIGLFLFVLGVLSNTFMLLSPTWGYRTSLFTYLFMSISFMIVFNQYGKEKKILTYILCGITIFTMLGYFVLYVNVSRCQKELEKSITKQLKEEKKVIEIEKFPYFINCNINPENDYHIEKFKKYYKIPDNVEIQLTSKHWKYFIIYSTK